MKKITSSKTDYIKERLSSRTYQLNERSKKNKKGLGKALGFIGHQ
jgi:hypothetical protein